MAALLFSLVILVTAGAWLTQKWLNRQKGQKRASEPGFSPERAISVQRYDAIDEVVSATRCHLCGERLETIAEGTRNQAGEVLRVVKAECRGCEEEVRLYFNTSDLLH